MKEPDQLHGLTCPQCGGVVPVPEGQVMVRCPHCDLRSLVRGERGLLRYQVPLQIDQSQATASLHKFLSGNLAISPAAKNQARLREALLVYLPFWAVWVRLAAWIFGQKEVGSGDNKHYEPREVRLTQELTWNGVACDVGEFGVEHVPPINQVLQPFNPTLLHEHAMVFEPVGSFSEADEAARTHFEQAAKGSAHLDRIGQTFLRLFQRRNALVYHPLWVLRYLFRGRSFQVVVDGYSGKVLYGKAPGNLAYRAAVLVFGMALGAFIAIDLPAFLISSSDSDNDLLGAVLFSLLFGLGIMYTAYRKYRHGEHYEFKADKPSGLFQIENPLKSFAPLKDVEKWIDRLS